MSYKKIVSVRVSYNTYDDYSCFQTECRVKQDLAEVLGLDEADIDVEVDTED